MRRAMLSVPIEEHTVSVEASMERLSLESEVLSNLLQTFKTTIPSFLANIINANGIVKGFLSNNNAKHDELVTKQKLVLLHLKQVDFINFGDRLITIPENFKGDLLEYSKKLTLITKELYNINNTTLVEYNAILASFLTNKDDKISNKNHLVLFQRVKTQRETISKQLGNFAKDTGKSKVRLRSVLARIGDLEPLIESCLELSKLHNKDVITNVNAAVEQSTELLDLIIKRIQDGDINNLSASSAMNIASGAYEVGKLVQLVAVVYADVGILLNVVTGITDSIIDSDKK